MAEKRKSKPIIFLNFSLYFLLTVPCFSMPLSTNGRWIVDSITGIRVKLACVNWPSHMETMLAEGLHEQPLKKIVALLVKQRFNCVRLTYATYMWTRYANRTVSESFDFLPDIKKGIGKNNPGFLSKKLPEAYEAVVDELGAQGVMSLLDNHVSKASWCCSETDGNTFFGDVYFDADEWIQGLTAVATRFRGKSKVMAISTRNELRGALQNQEDWYKYILKGASAIHKANPDVLIFASGLSYANDLTYLRKKTLGTNFDNKLVYDGHWYPWSWENAKSWDVEFLNDACYNKTQKFIKQTGFTYALKNRPVPLFMGEFGMDQRGLSRGDDHFLSCFLSFAADIDLDWGLWAWQGSYYYRQNKTGFEEYFGALDYHWSRLRSPQHMSRFDFLKNKLIEPSSKSPTTLVMFHPQSGTCVYNNGAKELLTGKCKRSKRWSYAGDGSPIILEGTNLCIQAIGDGLPPILSKNCSNPLSSWTLLTTTKLHIATMDETGRYLCLQKESPLAKRVITSKCVLTLSTPECQRNQLQDPTMQWFKLTNTNV
ncbi:glycosyl hydrolase 5 family protein-like [Mercurialis annua]|uniref:glycosyl hydrolase 5 family protein-like n=1 Tax=Mercurialis annua TaxID=3986 RepID=UPI0021607237|nr:glycosyl hydrolase 5 family protein-like [Mercurialis annua]